MKITVTIVRILTGLLFIFSGLVKAIDPLGLAYKMQEFFEVWARDGYMSSLMHNLDHYAVSFSIIMITLEVVVGVALLLGWQKKFTVWILLLLMLFFTFLTSFVLFTGKIRACGCFGDCIPLTPVQTFTKDIILLIFVFLLLFNTKYISPVAKPLINFLYVFTAAILTLVLQFHVLKHLPLIDCLPYKQGNNILTLRKIPADAVQDKYDYVFIYEKNGQKKDFPVTALPDSTWTFAERKQILVQKGKNNVSLINDFSFNTENGNDTIESILGQKENYYLLFIKDLENYPENWDDDMRLLLKIKDAGKKIYIITAQRDKVEERFNNKYIKQGNDYKPIIFTCDATAIKTAARANPTLFLMNGAVVQQKWSWADFDKVD